MPFAGRGGLPLFKKIRRYDISTKNLFVLSVQLLDNTEMECTLSENSTGEELLSHIAQRLNICEFHFFGLKFINKHLQYQWLALDVPLRRQLTKFAHTLFVKFSVRFYLGKINQLKDESTRYQFFLQLRNEIIEGALLCSPDQAVLLASYSLQAAYGDFDPDRHAPHHLKDFYLLPKRMSNQEEILMDLLREVSTTHRSFQGMEPAAAEMYYIMEAQTLEGYGEEYYAAKDASGNDLLLGTSQTGITIKHPTGRPLLSMAWSSLKTVSRNKRSICLECAGTGRTNQRMVQIFLENADFAAYVLTNITLQQDFYLNEPAANPAFPVTGADTTALAPPHPQAHPFRLMFRPDGTGMTNVRNGDVALSNGHASNGQSSGTSDSSYHAHADHHGPTPLTMQKPDVLDFARSSETYTNGHMPYEGARLPDREWLRREPSDPAAYREGSSYAASVVVHRSHHIPAGLDLVPVPVPVKAERGQHRLSWMNPAHLDASHDPVSNGHLSLSNHLQSSLANPLTSSTPELRTAANGLHPVAKPPRRSNPSLSCSTPDLVSMTGPVPVRRLLISRPEKSDVFVSHSQDLPVVRQTSVDELSPLDMKNQLPHFEAVLEEELSVSSLNHNDDKPEANSLTSPSRPLLLAAMNGLVLSNMALSEPPPVIHPASKDARRAELESRLSSGNVLIEFEQIPKKRRSSKGDECSVARLPENAARNRFPDVLPYDDTRVQIRRASKDNTRGYINASRIVLECGHLERQYIATQDPLENTVADFLNMVWEEQTRIVVVLSDLEGTQVPWRGLMTGDKEASLAGFTLKRENLSERLGYRTLSFVLSNKHDKHTRRKIWALHFEVWDSQGVPNEMEGFGEMVREVESVRRQLQTAPLILCRSGAARTGLLILLDFMALCLDHNQPVDIPRVLCHMRRQRMFMLQTLAQYRFVYAALVRHLNSSRLI